MKNLSEAAMTSSIKLELIQALKDAALDRAALLSKKLLKQTPSAGTGAWLDRTVRELCPQYFGHETRVAFLRSFTIEPVTQLVSAEALTNRIRTPIFIGEFNAYSQEIFDTKGHLRQFQPHLTFLSLLARSFVPEFTEFSFQKAHSPQAVIQRACEDLQRLFTAFLGNHTGLLIVSTLDYPFFRAGGIAESRHNTDSDAANGIAEINDIVSLIQFLLSDESKQICGTEIKIDGGGPINKYF